jgi:hypothetical protein
VPPAFSYDAAPVYAEVDTSGAPSYSTTVPSAAPTYAAPGYAAPTYEPPVYTPPSSASTYTQTTQPPPSPAAGAEPAGSEGERTGPM